MPVAKVQALGTIAVAYSCIPRTSPAWTGMFTANSLKAPDASGRGPSWATIVYVVPDTSRKIFILNIWPVPVAALVLQDVITPAVGTVYASPAATVVWMSSPGPLQVVGGDGGASWPIVAGAATPWGTLTSKETAATGVALSKLVSARLGNTAKGI